MNARSDDDATFAVRAPIAGRVLRVLQPSAGTVALGTPHLVDEMTARGMPVPAAPASTPVSTED